MGSVYGHGRRKGGGQGVPRPPWILKILAKKVIFLVSIGKKTNFTSFGVAWKKFGKIP